MQQPNLRDVVAVRKETLTPRAGETRLLPFQGILILSVIINIIIIASNLFIALFVFQLGCIKLRLPAACCLCTHGLHANKTTSKKISKKQENDTE